MPRLSASFIYRGGGGHGDAILATANDVNDWYCRNKGRRVEFNPRFKVKPGKVEVLYAEWAKQYEGLILVEPHIKGTFSGENKRWPWGHWEEVVRRWPGRLAQCSPKGKAVLDGVEHIETPSFAHLVSVLSVSRGVVTTEGGVHHAAGALRKPAVVIFGAFNEAKHFGYDFHINIEEPDPEGLGRRDTHPACVAAMQRITPDSVLAAMERLWN